ncbi:MAG: PAS domain-containing sensor histidine kinase, partial [Acinetobacter radioresistens]
MYEPYPVPELARDYKKFRYSSLWTFAKQDLRLLVFLLLVASLIGFGIGYFWSCIFIG